MTQDVPLVFVHGWGLNSTLWQPIIKGLSNYKSETIDLGFVKGGNTTWHDLTKPVHYIGHSLGVLWILNNPQLNIKSLISINGFDCFYKFTPTEIFQQMQQGLEKDAKRQMAHFWRLAGCKNFANAEQLKSEQLKQGLEWLATIDATDQLNKCSVPVKALASLKDKIVPEKAAAECWGKRDLVWHQSASHCLPIDDPAWCAQEIRQFLK